MKDQRNIKKHRLSFRVTDMELEEIKRKMNELGVISKTDFFLACIFNRQVRVVKIDKSKIKVYTKLSNVQEEIKQIGVNINQITKVINSHAKNHQLSNEVFKVGKELDDGLKIIEKNRKIIEIIVDNFI